MYVQYVNRLNLNPLKGLINPIHSIHWSVSMYQESVKTDWFAFAFATPYGVHVHAACSLRYSPAQPSPKQRPPKKKASNIEERTTTNRRVCIFFFAAAATRNAQHVHARACLGMFAYLLLLFRIIVIVVFLSLQ